MAANDPIGNVKEIILLTDNSVTQTTDETNISKSFTVKTTATYNQVDSAMRGLAWLSTDSYNDTLLITQISVGEVLAED